MNWLRIRDYSMELSFDSTFLFIGTICLLFTLKMSFIDSWGVAMHPELNMQQDFLWKWKIVSFLTIMSSLFKANLWRLIGKVTYWFQQKNTLAYWETSPRCIVILGMSILFDIHGTYRIFVLSENHCLFSVLVLYNYVNFSLWFSVRLE